jgi:hypothetical protein
VVELTDEFDLKFAAIQHEVPLRERHPDIPIQTKMMLKAKLDLIVLETLPHEMNVDEMMEVSRAAYDSMLGKWIEWIQKGAAR